MVSICKAWCNKCTYFVVNAVNASGALQMIAVQINKFK